MFNLCLSIGFAVIFFLKILWNFGVPYDLLWKEVRRHEYGRRVSLMPGIEFVTFLLWLLFAFLSNNGFWVSDPKIVALIGLIAIAGSYLHLIVIGFIGSFLSSKSMKR